MQTESQYVPYKIALIWLAAWLQGHQQIDCKLFEDRDKADTALLHKYVLTW